MHCCGDAFCEDVLSCVHMSQSQPHELVYAKVTGYPYWPAKVMEVKPDGCDVRFFGPGHHRYNEMMLHTTLHQFNSLFQDNLGKPAPEK